MAKQVRPQNTGTQDTRTFGKDLVEDVKNYNLPPNSWTQARNAVPNTILGDLGDLSNEQGNALCTSAPYTVIGVIHLEADRWAVFSTDNTNSEIGVFDETACEYTTVVNDSCLNFSTYHLIKGVAKESFDCTWDVYWDDGNNPSRTMNLDNVPWIQNCVDDNGVAVPTEGYEPVGCITCTDTDALDCEEIKLSPRIVNPCFRIEQGPGSGELLNGSYYVTGAYTVNQQRVTDYSMPSNVIGLFDHIGIAGSIDITIEQMDDERFDEFELVIVYITSQQTVAKSAGFYSTRQKRITLDSIDTRWVDANIGDLFIRTPIADKSDAMYRNGDYMLRVGPTDKFNFNYQPLANQIETRWVSVEYPANYYRKNGQNTGYMRDEVYAFFIRWVYDTGDKSPSFHIPGRVATSVDTSTVAGNDADPEIAAGLTPYRWRVYNTASITSLATSTLPDGGVQIAEGKMGYWESSEKYDDDRPQIWNASSDPIWGSTLAAHDLCGKQIRHHKFPDNGLDASSGKVTNHYAPGGNAIRVMGVKFANIKPPLDNDGNPISNVVGYEILRATRQGNKSIFAKGMLNNMRTHTVSQATTNRTSLHPNYPYNDLRPDPYLTETDIGAGSSGNNTDPQSGYRKDVFTFLSPETSFQDPFLSAKELKIYGELNGTSEGNFIIPDGHPKNAIVTDFAFIIASIVGLAYAVSQTRGSKKTTYHDARHLNQGTYPIPPVINAFLIAGFASGNGQMITPIDFGASSSGAKIAINTASAAQQAVTTNTGVDIPFLILGQSGDNIILQGNQIAAWNIANAPLGAVPGTMGAYKSVELEDGDNGKIPGILNAFATLAGASPFLSYWSQGTDVALELIKAFSKLKQYGLQYVSHCPYTEYKNPVTGNIRRRIRDAAYLDNQLQDFGTQWRINNLYRGRTVVLETLGADVDNPTTTDNTRQTLKSLHLAGDNRYEDPTEKGLTTTAASHYVGLKQRQVNQYGQLEGLVQVPVSTCSTPIDQTSTDPLFNGDIYIGRFTEKNTLHFFYEWLLGQPNETPFNYRFYKMIPHPCYWMDTDPIDFSEVISSILGNILSPSSWVFPSDKSRLDRESSVSGIFVVKEAYMYLFNSGVRDFFVESEINVEQRDWGDNDTERHYAPDGSYTNLPAMFNSSIIKAGNFYKYDLSLSVARLFNNYTSWGNTQLRSYDPSVADECYTYRPNRVIYSLPQNLENLKDNWKIFLPNNYRDFKSRVTAIKPVNKNGALILFENESPVQFQGVDTLQTDADNKLVVGDGGLFSQPLQNVLNTDEPYEYGSCQNRLSVINTASGIFWMSQNQGKIFQLQQGVREISAQDMKWWFSEFLPYKLTEDFPDFELKDNPVAGIGCQSIYNNDDQIVYFCKKDYELRKDITDEVTYTGSNDDFLVNNRLPIKLGDPRYFRSASWTVSYDPKTQGWISYHDWHPDLLIPGKEGFLSTKGSDIWRHNDGCTRYCNYYGVDYPFEVEFATVTPQQVTTLRSIEYFMEVYKYADNCYDRFHELDFNFDEAIIYNSEQCSGLLRLNLSPKNNAPEIINYPQINPTNIGILYSKEEQKYRFNQFWDITADRGEFNPVAQRVIFNTQPNGYIRDLNPNNLNYNKNQVERKKFRHYKNTVLLRRRVCGDKNMIVSLANTKKLLSPR